MVSIDEAEAMLNEITEELPSDFFTQLNGGVCLLPEAKRHPEARGDDLYIMGEYHRDAMGRYIYIYYGSFARIHGHLSPEEFKKQLRKTLLHEFTHHFENRAGERGLEIKDAIQMEHYRNRGRGRRYKGRWGL